MTTSPAVHHLVVMGVSGTGKTTLAEGIAEAMGWDLAEGDDFHPQANIDKMSAGTPLTDEDRWPWLESIGEWITQHERASRSAVVTCSALRRVYRDLLRRDRPHVSFVMVDVDPDELRRRMERRTGHFMKASMLESQLRLLEPLQPDEPHVSIQSQGPEAVLAEALDELGLRAAPTD